MRWDLWSETARLADRAQRGDPYWPAQLSIAGAIALNLALSEQVTVGPRWVLPGVEAVLLVALIVAAPARAAYPHGSRRFALALAGLVSLAYLVSLALLVHYLVAGGHTTGQSLIGSGALLWATNVLLFAVWFWELDRGGPVARFQGTPALNDFQFPQMDNPKLAPPDWRPGFGDYLYVSLTNATAFSPTDTLPLTQSAKLVMGVQSVSALLTIGLVIARAVNILG